MVDSASETFCSTPQRPSWLPAAAKKPFATAFGTPTTTHTTPPPRYSSAAPPTTTLRGAHTLDTLMKQATQVDSISLKLHQVPGQEVGWWSDQIPLSLIVTQTLLERHYRISSASPPWTKTHSACCAATPEFYCALRPEPQTLCGGPRFLRSRPGSRPSTSEGERGAPTPSSDGLPAAWDFTVTSCLRPARNAGPTTTTRPRHRTSLNTKRSNRHCITQATGGIRMASASLQWSSMDTRGAGETPPATWSPRSPNDLAPSHRAT